MPESEEDLVKSFVDGWKVKWSKLGRYSIYSVLLAFFAGVTSLYRELGEQGRRLFDQTGTAIVTVIDAAFGIAPSMMTTARSVFVQYFDLLGPAAFVISVIATILMLVAINRGVNFLA